MKDKAAQASYFYVDAFSSPIYIIIDKDEP